VTSAVDSPCVAALDGPDLVSLDDAAKISAIERPGSGLARAPVAAEELIEEQIFDQSCRVVSAAMAFADIDPGQPEPPPEWVEIYGPEEAKRRLRIASSAWLSKKDAPMGISVAMQIHTGITTARARRGETGGRVLNVGVLNLALPGRSYDEQEIIEVERR
jgi:hypothetical protein